jgi:AcrR family transcriptional regulator
LLTERLYVQHCPLYARTVTSIDQPPLRKDAERSRAAILIAARELFSTGREVPMYRIGQRAGVGQATLYRHFPDRSAVVAALGREHVARIEAIASEHEGDERALLVVLDAAVEMLVSLHGIVGLLREDAVLAPVLRELRERMLTVLDGALRSSGAALGLRDDLQARDLVLVLNMITGALDGVATAAERTVTARRGLDLALNGVRG